MNLTESGKTSLQINLVDFFSLRIIELRTFLEKTRTKNSPAYKIAQENLDLNVRLLNIVTGVKVSNRRQ